MEKRILLLLALLSVLLIAGCDFVTRQQVTPLEKGQPPVIESFEASPPSISAGQTSTLSWKVSGATSVTIDQGIGNVAAVTGTRVVTPTTTTTYTLTATNPAGSTTSTTQVIVVVAPPAPPSPPAGLPVINYFTASPSSIPAGSSVTLSWNVSNATSVTIDQGVGAVGTSGSTSVFPATTTVYTLTASNASGSSTASALVVVSVPPPPTPAPFAVLSVVAMVDPPSFTGFCPKDFSCSAAITVNGPGTVTYRWEWSDGGSSPWQTVDFTSAGTKVVTTGWPRDSSGSYWVRVRTLSPNQVVSNHAVFSLTCLKFIPIPKIPQL